MTDSLAGRNGQEQLEVERTSHPGRVVVPRLIRDPTPLDLLKTTLRTCTSVLLPLSPLSSPTSPSLRADRRRHSTQVSNKSPKLGVAKTHTPRNLESGENQGLGLESAFELSSEHDLTSREEEGEDQTVWSRWDELNDELDGVGLKRVLILAYTTGIAIWDCTSLDHFSEILNIESIDVLLSQSTALSSQLPLGVGSILDAAILPSPVVPHGEIDVYQSSRPLIAILTHRENTSFSHVLLYSLTSHSFLNNTIEISGTAHALKSNKRFVVISSSSPSAVHVLSSTSFLPISSSPLTDVAPNPFDGSPVFDLGQGGRMLCYATTTPIPSRDGRNALPGSGIIAAGGMFESDDQSLHSNEGASHGFLEEAGHVGGEVARRVGEGVLSGVKAIGGLGMDYWNSRHGVEREDNDATSRSESRSAPLPTILGFEKKFSAGGGAGSPSKSNGASTSRDRYLDSNTSGSVIVVDLLSSPSSPTKSHRSSGAHRLKILAHFRCSSSLALLSFNPSSSLLLTASAQAHSFDIFEIKPAVSVGMSATTVVGGKEGGGKVWHRYRLNRGFTSARARRAEWSRDSRFVGVCTGKGTTHIYATQPFGGPPDLGNHFSAKVSNAQRLQPLSVTLSTVSRVRHLPTSEEDLYSSTIPSILVPSIQFIAKAHSISSCVKPDPVHRKADSARPAPTSPHLFPPDPISFQDVLLFYPQTGLCALNRLSSVPAPTTTSEAASRGDVGRIATTAVSNLSTMMNNRGIAVDKGKKKEKGVEWVVESVRKAEWNVGRRKGGVRVAELRERTNGKKRKESGAERYGAQVEIETFSRSTHVLPRSIYQSQQFDFFSLPSNFALLAAVGTSSSPLRRLEVRSAVQIRQGGTSTDSHSQQNGTLLRSPSSESSFDQPILSAMQTILDHDGILSPSSLAPTFPNGVPGRRGRWRDTIHISAVGPTVNEGLGRVRRELGRVGSIVPKRRASAGTAYSSSISFEDEDAVWANEHDESFHHSESGSTACTSEPEGGSDDTSWGLEGFAEDETGRKDVMDIPFEEDDDFFLDLAVDKPNTSIPEPAPVSAVHAGIISMDVAGQDSSSSGIGRSSPEERTQSRVGEVSCVAPVLKKTRKIRKQISRPTIPLPSVD